MFVLSNCSHNFFSKQIPLQITFSKDFACLRFLLRFAHSKCLTLFFLHLLINQGQSLLLHFFPLYFYFLFHTTFSTNLAYKDSRQPSSCSPLFSVYSRILLSPSQDPNSLHAKHSLLLSEWIQQPYGKVNPLLGWFPSSILGGCLLFSKDYSLLYEHF